MIIIWKHLKVYGNTVEITVNNNGFIVAFNAVNVSDSYKVKHKITDQAGNEETKDVGIIVPLKYLSIFWRTVKIPLKKTAGGAVKNEIMQIEKLAGELNKPIIGKFEKWKLHLSL